MEDKETQQPMFSENLKKPLRKKNPKRMRIAVIAILAVAALAALTYLALKWAQIQDSAPIEIIDHSVILISKQVEDVRRIHISGNKELTLTKSGGTYHNDRVDGRVLSQEACNNAFANAAQLVAARTIEGDMAQDDYGLDNPAATVTIDFADGTTQVLTLGAPVPTQPFRYMRLEEDKNVYMLKNIVADLYLGNPASYRNIEQMRIDVSTAKELTFEWEGQESVVLTYVPKPSGLSFTAWQMTAPLAFNCDLLQVEALLQSIAQITLDGYQTTTQNMGEYGLDHPWARLTLLSTAADPFVLNIGKKTATGEYYIRLGDGADVYRIKADNLTFMTGLRYPTLLSEFANIVALPQIASLAVTQEGQMRAFDLVQGADGLAVTTAGVSVDVLAFKAQYERVYTMGYDDIADPAKLSEDAKGVLTLVYTFVDGTTATVEYLDYDINNYALCKNGAPTVLVRKDACAQMLQGWKTL